MAKKKVVNVSGKRKTAVARASLKAGEGRIRINRVPLEIYQPELARLKILEPLSLAGEPRWTKVDIDISVEGGGVMGQADAVRTAVARALVEYSGDDELQELYTAYDRTLLAPDTRYKLPKNQLGRGARKKRQKSYR